MSLFGDGEGTSRSSNLFGESEAEDPYSNPHLSDSPDDTEGDRKFRNLLQIAGASFALVAVLVAGIYFFGRNEARPQDSAKPSSTATIPPSSGSDSESGLDKSNGDAPSNLNDVIRSVVLVAVGSREKFCATGSGFSVGDGSIIVTNDHVIESSAGCRVDFIGIFVTSDPSEEPEPTFVGTVLSKDPTADLAVLAITDRAGVPGKLPPLQLSTEKVTVGEPLQIVGYPGTGGFTVTVTRGTVSGFTTDETGRWIKTDASISGGNSGGAAINSAGKVVGVPTQAGGGGADVVDCREFDTNNDGVINSKDSCVPIGGFLNRLRPADYVIQAIRQVK